MMPRPGGLGLPAGDALTIMQAMGAHFVPGYAASLAAAQLLQDLGSTAQQARWLPSRVHRHGPAVAGARRAWRWLRAGLRANARAVSGRWLLPGRA